MTMFGVVFRPRLAVLLPLFLCAALLFGNFDRKSLGTKIVANGNLLVLSWDKDHPWSAQLNIGTSLMAEYATAANGVVIERIGSVRPSAFGERSLHFPLPESLIAAPLGPVCLYFQVGTRILPVRKANAQADETTRFRDPDWETHTAARSRASSRNSQISQLKSEIAAANQAIQKSTAALAAGGHQSVQECDTLQPPPFAAAEKPPDVLPLADHESAAHRVCLSRVAWGQAALTHFEADKRFDIAVRLVPPPDTLHGLLAFIKQHSSGTQNLGLRELQLSAFTADWTRWASQAAAYRSPPFGHFDDELLIQDLSSLTGALVLQLGADGHLVPSPKAFEHTDNVAGFVGAALESYSRCIVDGQHQLQAKLQAWNDMEERAPQLAAVARQQLVSACRRQFSDLNALSQSKARIENELLALEHKGDSIAPRSTSVNGPRVLNGTSCNARATTKDNLSP